MFKDGRAKTDYKKHSLVSLHAHFVGVNKTTVLEHRPMVSV